MHGGPKPLRQVLISVDFVSLCESLQICDHRQTRNLLPCWFWSLQGKVRAWFKYNCKTFAAASEDYCFEYMVTNDVYLVCVLSVLHLSGLWWLEVRGQSGKTWKWKFIWNSKCGVEALEQSKTNLIKMHYIMLVSAVREGAGSLSKLVHWNHLYWLNGNHNELKIINLVDVKTFVWLCRGQTKDPQLASL